MTIQNFTDTDQSDTRDSKGRFKKGSKPANGFNKNPQNIAPGGLWRYKEHGKAAIIDIFKMSVADFDKLHEIKDADRTVLDEILFTKFKSAMNGNSRESDFLFNQAFGCAPKFNEAKIDYQTCFSGNAFSNLTYEEVEKLLRQADMEMH